MAYATGSASDIAGLLTFIRNSCTANGWTLSGGVLHKGSTYVEVVADGVVGIRIIGGTGIDGSFNLTGANSGYYAYLGTVAAVPLTYPLTCEVYINTAPDEVYVVINFSTNYYEQMAWGISDTPGLAGSGVWYHATRCLAQGSSEYSLGLAGFSPFANFSGHADGFPLFCAYTGTEGSGTNGINNSFIHSDVDALGWHPGSGAFPSSFAYVYPLNAYLPNLWNGETVLLPYPVYVPRASGSKNTMVADLKHIRHVRIDNHEPGDIITLGPDQWKFYPWFRKDATARDGGEAIFHSGTLGFALRYTGP